MKYKLLEIEFLFRFFFKQTDQPNWLVWFGFIFEKLLKLIQTEPLRISYVWTIFLVKHLQTEPIHPNDFHN